MSNHEQPTRISKFLNFKTYLNYNARKMPRAMIPLTRVSRYKLTKVSQYELRTSLGQDS